FNPCSFAESKTLKEGELSKLLLKAENGSLSAQLQVARAYSTGRAAGKTDYEQAARWYRKAADQGDPDAQNNLGTFYLLGHGVARSDAEAVRWFQRAAASAY